MQMWHLALQLRSEGLQWWQPCGHFAIALVVGIIVADYIYRDESWYDMITSKHRMHWYGIRTYWSNQFENYIAIIFFITLFGWATLNMFARRFL